MTAARRGSEGCSITALKLPSYTFLWSPAAAAAAHAVQSGAARQWSEPGIAPKPQHTAVSIRSIK